MATEPENLILTELRGLRRELQASLENQELFAKRQAQFQQTLAQFQQTLTELRGDVILLENHNITRHTEILQILHRLEDVDRRTPMMEE
jgi:DNA integrity scanning protein DisA with diadenylate cyclase activity